MGHREQDGNVFDATAKRARCEFAGCKPGTDGLNDSSMEEQRPIDRDILR